MRTANELAVDISGLIRPGEKLTPVEAAEKYLIVKSGGVAQKWNPELTPEMREPLNCIASRKYEAVILVASAQSGKTTSMVLGSMAFAIKNLKSDFMVMQTTKDMALGLERQHLGWSIRNSPELKKELADGGSADNRLTKEFKNGQLLFIAYPTIDNLSAKPLAMMILTDYDRMLPIAGQGSVFNLAKKRTTSFLSKGITIAESSISGIVTDTNWRPNSKHPHEAPPSDSQILNLYNLGERRRYYMRCPECGELFLPAYDHTSLHFSIEKDNFDCTVSSVTETPKYACTANGCLIDINHKRDMVKNGRWISEAEIMDKDETSRIASFWFPGTFSAFSDPVKMVNAYLSGLREYDLTGNDDTLQAVINTDFNAPLQQPKRTSEYNAMDYIKRAEDLDEKTVPIGVRFLVATIDVQSWGFSVLVVGYGVNHERWLVDRYEMRLSERKDGDKFLNLKPSVYLEDWLLIRDRVMASSYPLCDGSKRKMKIMVTASDSNGEAGVTQRAYDFWKTLKKQRLNSQFRLIKGERPKPHSHKPAVRKSYPESQSSKTKARGEIPLWIVNTTMLKDALSADLKRSTNAPRYIHFPKWLPETAYQELTVEYRDATLGWIQPKNKKNELFDQLCYAEAAVLSQLIEDRKKVLDWDNPPIWALDWNDNPLVIFGDQVNLFDVQNAETKKDIQKKPVNNKKSSFINHEGKWL